MSKAGLEKFSQNNLNQSFPINSDILQQNHIKAHEIFKDLTDHDNS